MSDVKRLSDGFGASGHDDRRPWPAATRKRGIYLAMSAMLNLIYREYCRARVAEMCSRRALMSAAELIAADSK